MDFSVSHSMSEQLTPFLSFERQRWAELRKSVPLTLTEQDLKPLLGINEELSLDEVRTIYLPLVRLINYYIDENIRRQNVLRRFLGEHYQYCWQCSGREKHLSSDSAITLKPLAEST